MLYCVFYKDELIGRFKTQEKAIEYFEDIWINGIGFSKSSLILKTMTKEEYENYCKDFLKKILDDTI